MSDVKYAYYHSSKGYKISNKTDSDVLLAGGGTKPEAEFTAGLASDANVVHKTGAETIDGSKTFTSSINASLTGNASTATTLQTARTINGSSFNGSANITTANWGTARTITVGGTAKSVDGSAAVSWNLNEIGAPARAELGASENSLKVLDTRNVNPVPNVDLKRGVWFDFKMNSTIGLSGAGTFSAVMTVVSYNDASGNNGTAFRLAQSNGDMYFQQGSGNSWLAWNKLLSTTNFATLYPDLNAIENLSGTTGLLKKTAANTWALDTNSYLTSGSLNGYAQTSGANAVGTWATDSNGLFVNGTVGLKTFGPGGINTSLNDATYGSVAGVINNPGTAVGNPTGDWYHRIKMLHQNTAGYFTEIAVAMTGAPGLYYKQFSNGLDSGWFRTADVYEDTSTGAVIDCAIMQHSLFYLRVRNGNQVKVENAQQGQRFVIFNVDGSSSSDVDINGATGTLSPYTKISCYITNVGEVIFYDKAEMFVGGGF